MYRRYEYIIRNFDLINHANFRGRTALIQITFLFDALTIKIS